MAFNVGEFLEYAESIGEYVQPDTSSAYIKAVFEHQKYWAGNTYRIYYKDGEFTHELRRFGKEA